ncbi:LuxR family transcriptional regulator [Microbacterium candidum]|uniref:LuxR C-terminal-related transcriptional regulator n=1 Tax=Microbacterium candidum TaxID=3041922 RepID=A0ABT7N031_9MICO|nr:LuxR family transcriptional regulator [Microbacterium sp. ASV49]MDL9980042.1 LuxR C-terminal-related transcriptional regulator [Microbacterium sp. ASV49]
MLLAGADLESLLLESKTTAPIFNPAFVRRPELVEALRTDGSRLVTVTAPAGYGKSSLLAEWEQVEDRATGWLTLRVEDDDPAAVLRLLAYACERFASAASSVFTVIATSRDDVLGRMAPAVALVLSQCERPFVLFVDDLHVLQNPECLDVLEVVLGGVPAGSQVVLASRHHPTRLARGRVANSSAHIGAADLRIDPAGAARIAEEAGALVDADMLQDWVERCDGWAAGLHMCALLSKRRPFESFSDDAVLADYLYQECVRDLPEDTRQFLLQSSILGAHIPDLCDAVLQRSDSARILRDLETRQLFVTADRAHRAYRLHPLFREYLTGALEIEAASSIPALHQRASSWFAERGQLPAAIDHAISAGAFELATSLVTVAALPAYEAGQSATLGRWLREIGDANLLLNPSAVVVITWFAVLAGTDDDARKWSTLLRRVPDDAEAPGVTVPTAKAMIRAIMLEEGIESALADAEFAAELEPLDSPWRDPAVQILGSTLLHAGHTERATTVLSEAIHMADAHGNPATVVICESEFALLAIERGDWEAADEHAERAMQAIRAGGIDGYVMAAYPHAAAACIALNAGRRTAGLNYLASAMSERHRCGKAVPLLAIPTRLLLIRAQLRAGDAEAAELLLEEIQEILPPRRVLGSLGHRVSDAHSLVRTHALSADRGSPSVSLTAAEQRLLPLLQTHLTRAEIAQRLYVSTNTISTQMGSIFRKLGASTRSQAVERAYELDLLGTPSGVAESAD